MKILLIGGTGFISGETARLARAAGHEVMLFNRGQRRAGADLPAVHGDVDDILAFRRPLRAFAPEAVVHSVAYNEKHARDLAELFRGERTRLVALSSIDGYEAFQQANRGKEISDYPLDEGMSVSSIRRYLKDSKHPYADSYDKNLMADALLASASEAVVLRVPCVYGPGDSQYAQRHGPFIRRIHDGRSSLVFGAAEQAALITHGYVENVAAAVLRACLAPAIEGKTYNIGEMKVRTPRRWADLYARAAGMTFKHHVLPDALLESDSALRDRPAGHYVVDCSRFRIEAGFQDPVSLEESVARTLSWALANPSCLGEKPDYEKEDRLIARYDAFWESP